MITVGNVYNKSTHKGTLLYVGRKSSFNKCPVGTRDLSVLGNPFYIKDESERNKVCDQFADLIRKNYEWKENILMLKPFHISPSIFTLLCFCFPKRCHATEIIKLLEEIS